MKKKMNSKTMLLLGWLPAVVVLVVALFLFPGIFSYLNSQAELMSKVRQIVDVPVKEISLVPGHNSRDTNFCYVTRSQDEISRIVKSLRDVKRQISKGTSRREPFVITLTFEDESQAYFLLYRRADDLSRAHLDKIEYAQSKTSQPKLVGDAGLEFREIGTWAADLINLNNCR